ncbi:hypothetical protein AQJ30_05325 [Streptomyces longwoodensis]|uniref:DUF4232 domain-containing protein n=1 Tax=Streptomyces longwoodensis TaxID=68231 RepID=A0A124HS00_9ACTN|nr:DUF4232 domain-containing protein [Streptomyces longwoodensis]KUN40109.1 hypothetical protein AQJ30_05325 [Streptomyces longwoodensis]
MPRPAPLLLPALSAAALSAVLLLTTACGTEHAGRGVDAAAATPGARSAVTDPPVDGVRVTSVTLPADPAPSPTRGGPGVHADPLPAGTPGAPGATRVSAAYEVTNSGSVAMTYTIVFTFADATGGAMDNRTRTVPGVGPGRTVRGTVTMEALPPGASSVTRVKVLRVTKVPASEAPAAPGVCPPSGIRVTADDGDAAMGLRVVGLRLDNCGTRAVALDGYPDLTVLDADREPVDGVRVLHGSGGIATVTGFDDPPRPFTLAPGRSASAGLMWRNTTGSGAAVDAPYVRVRALPGADPVTVTPHLDLGTTGRLGVSAWKPVP